MKLTSIVGAKVYLYLFREISFDNQKVTLFFKKVKDRSMTKINCRLLQANSNRSFMFLREHSRTLTWGFLGSSVSIINMGLSFKKVQQ